MLGSERFRSEGSIHEMLGSERFRSEDSIHEMLGSDIKVSLIEFLRFQGFHFEKLRHKVPCKGSTINNLGSTRFYIKVPLLKI